MLPLIYELSDLKQFFDLRSVAPYLTILVSLLLISKFPTFSFKKISIQRKFTIFILLAIGVSFISLMFFTFETLVVFGILYFITMPLAFIIYFNKSRTSNSKDLNEEHEDIL